jgi:hypothetical protein
LCASVERRVDRLDLYIELRRIFSRPLQDWLEIYERHLRLVAVEESKSTEILTEFALHSDLDHFVFEEDAVVLEEESEESRKV